MKEKKQIKIRKKKTIEKEQPTYPEGNTSIHQRTVKQIVRHSRIGITNGSRGGQPNGRESGEILDDIETDRNLPDQIRSGIELNPTLSHSNPKRQRSQHRHENHCIVVEIQNIFIH
jgi:hypothetical protein